PEEIRKKVSMIVTDPSRIRKDDPGHPEVCTAFEFYKIFEYPDLKQVEHQCRGGEIGCVQCKKRLAEIIGSELSPIYEKRLLLEKQTGLVEDLINKGCIEAEKVAAKTMGKVRKAMKIDY
ncbi:MAG: tryptophan--tRNA ligase, partial [Eubacteriales bacterium]|nr:tryptophan--tRNA ligase [Eubacteriales bacterium]